MTKCVLKGVPVAKIATSDQTVASSMHHTFCNNVFHNN